MLVRQEKDVVAPCWPVAIAATVLTGLLRLIPHPANFAGMGALSLYAGARLPWYLGLGLPLIVMVFTDTILAGALDYQRFNRWVYGCYFVTAIAGLLLRRTNSPWKIGIAAVFCDLMFFIVTNFGDWLDPQMGYPQTWAGLMTCYEAAIPFHRNTVISTLVFVPLFFGAHAFVMQWAQVRSPIATGEQQQ